jgi:hypothetical protein
VLFEGVLGYRIKVSGERQITAHLGLFWGLFKWVFGCRIKGLGEGQTTSHLGLL